jgi:hypothetical protein
MADEDTLFSGKEPADTDQTEIRQPGVEEQSTTSIPPIELPAQASVADEATVFIPPDPMAPAQATLSSVPLGAQMPPGYSPTVAYSPNYAQPGYPQSMYQQPGMPALAQPGQPGQPVAPKKRRVGLWVLLGIIVALLLGSGTALAIVANLGPTDTPTQVLQEYCDGYMKANAQEVYNTLSSTSQSKNSLADIQQSVDALKNLSGLAKLTACKVSEVQQNGSNASGTITLTENVSFGNISLSVPIAMGLVLENNAWKIDVFQTHSNFLFPTPASSPGIVTPTASQQ